MNTTIEDLNRCLVRSLKQNIYDKYYGLSTVKSIVQKIEKISYQGRSLKFYEIQNNLNGTFFIFDLKKPYGGNSVEEVRIPLDLSHIRNLQSILFSFAADEIKFFEYSILERCTDPEKAFSISRKRLEACEEEIKFFTSEFQRVRKEEIFNITLLLRSRIEKKIVAGEKRKCKIKYTFQEFEASVEKEKLKVGDRVIVGTKENAILSYASFPKMYKMDEENIWTITKIEGDYKYLEQGKKKKKVKRVYKYFLIQPEFEETYRLLEKVKKQLENN